MRRLQGAITVRDLRVLPLHALYANGNVLSGPRDSIIRSMRPLQARSRPAIRIKVFQESGTWADIRINPGYHVALTRSEAHAASVASRSTVFECSPRGCCLFAGRGRSAFNCPQTYGPDHQLR